MKKIVNAQTVEKAQEVGLVTFKGGISMIPIIGPVASEWIGLALPNRRMDRVERMLSFFVAKVSNLPPNLLDEKLQEPEFANIFEQSLYSATKAMTEERLKYIANILAKCTEKDVELLFGAHCLDVIENLNDLSIATLLFADAKIGSHIRNYVPRPTQPGIRNIFDELSSETIYGFFNSYFDAKVFDTEYLKSETPPAFISTFSLEQLVQNKLFDRVNGGASYRLTKFGLSVADYIKEAASEAS